MAICGTWHASWTVADMGRSLAFYVDMLGLEIVHEQIQDNAYTRKLVGVSDARLHVVLLKIPGHDPGRSGHVIELVEYQHPKGARLDTTPSNICAAHFAFIVDDAADMHRQLSTAGVSFVSPPVAITAGRNRGGYTCYLRDPDGFVLEIFQAPNRLSSQ